MVVTPFSNVNLRLTAQAGVDGVVMRYPAIANASQLDEHCARLAELGLKLSVVEGYLPMRAIIRGAEGRDHEIDQIKSLLREMGRHSIPLLCYNFMPNQDWTRTSTQVETRGSATTNEFNLRDWADPQAVKIEESRLWANLSYFLDAVLPVAEACGVVLAMHPDDPPIPRFGPSAQIFSTVEGFERLTETWPSPSNRICFCQGTFAEMGVDIPATIRRLSDRIAYVHFRDVVGTVPHFIETFHDNGKTDMAAAMRAYREIGYRGPMRPDHVPKMEGESGEADGYTMLGRLFAVGYMKGLIDATGGTDGN